MNNSNKNFEDIDRRQITLEELLKLKTHERPPKEFWEDFETAFKDRTLQSVVRKKSWFGKFRISFPNPFVFLLSAVVVLLVAFFISVPQDPTLSNQGVVSLPLPEIQEEADSMVAVIEATDEVQFIEEALTLNDTEFGLFETEFPSNDWRAISSDSITYVEESLTTLLVESEPIDHRAIF